MSPQVKIKMCGLTTVSQVDAAVKAGANYLGFVFFKRSPRAVDFDFAAKMAKSTPKQVARVGLVVDVDDAFLTQLCQSVDLDYLQLHGQETPQRVSAIRDKYRLPVIKAIGIARPEDLDQISVYESVADQLLIDAKPVTDAALPGGNGHRFDWNLLRGRKWRKPWLLAGGLNAENVAQAIVATGAKQVDVSSGIERKPGVKDPLRMVEFADAVRTASITRV